MDGQLVPLPETVPRYPRPTTPVGAMQPEEDDQSAIQTDCKKVPVIPFQPVENLNMEGSMIARLLQDASIKSQSTLVAPTTTNLATNNKRSITPAASTVVSNTRQNNLNLSQDFPTVDFSALLNDTSDVLASLGIEPRTAEQVVKCLDLHLR